MGVEVVTKDDLEVFRLRLLDDIKKILQPALPMKKEWLKSNEVRKLLKVSPGTLQNLRISRKLQPSKMGGFYITGMMKLKNYWKVHAKAIIKIRDIMETLWRKHFMALHDDERINVWHLGLFMSLLCCWEIGGYVNPFPITRREVMKLSHIGSLPTYHKYMKELVEFGYIKYVPSYHPVFGSLIWIEGIGD